MMEGWVKLYRQVYENPRSRDPLWLAVWVYILLHCTHKPVSAIWKGKKIMLKPGQLITGRKAIAGVAGVKESKVYRVLKVLESEQQIEQQPGNASSLITVLNWDLYQGPEQQNEQPANSQRTTNEQPSNSHRTAGEQPVNTNNNVKNERSIRRGSGQAERPRGEWHIATQLKSVEERIEELRSRSPGGHCSLADFLSKEEMEELSALQQKRKDLGKELRAL